tara:strand:- start:1550 stop:1783 length:234 start_codon:yes stop_codon:yes gene_type:complete
MVEFKTLSSEDVKFGKNNFIEVARKVAISDEGENEFISMSRGFFTPEGEKRYSRGKNIALPVDKDTLKKIAELIGAA